MNTGITSPIIGVTADIELRGSREYLYLQTPYARCIEDAGGVPVVLPPLSSSIALLGKLDGVLFTGGEDIHPRYYGEEIAAPLELSPDIRTDFETSLLAGALRLEKPILAICHGMQLVNVALAGTLWQDLATQRPESIPHRASSGEPCSHVIAASPGSLLQRVTQRGEFVAASYHHQAIKALGKGIVASAHAQDGVVEAMELSGYPFLLGVQWHPEKTPGDEVTLRLFTGFLEACRRS